VETESHPLLNPCKLRAFVCPRLSSHPWTIPALLAALVLGFNDISNFRSPPRPVLVRPVRRKAFHPPPRSALRLVQPPSTRGWCLAGASSTLDFGEAVQFLWALPPHLRLQSPQGAETLVYASHLIPLEICLPRPGAASCGTSRGKLPGTSEAGGAACRGTGRVPERTGLGGVGGSREPT
jgi:hypothetical protein